MPDPELGSVTLFWQKLQAGDPAAVENLWQRYFPRMLGLARKTLTGRVQRVADAEDAVQSAFFAFYRQASQGLFDGILDREDLWKLLALITVRKSRRQIRHQRAAKRGGGKVADEAGLLKPDAEVAGLAELAATLPTQEFDVHLEELLELLDEELRAFALLRLFGHKNREIADQLDCTERKVERKLRLVRQVWEGELDV